MKKPAYILNKERDEPLIDILCNLYPQLSDCILDGTVTFRGDDLIVYSHACPHLSVIKRNALEEVNGYVTLQIYRAMNYSIHLSDLELVIRMMLKNDPYSLLKVWNEYMKSPNRFKTITIVGLKYLGELEKKDISKELMNKVYLAVEDRRNIFPCELCPTCNGSCKKYDKEVWERIPLGEPVDIEKIEEEIVEEKEIEEEPNEIKLPFESLNLPRLFRRSKE
jgi:hypothetical protein